MNILPRHRAKIVSLEPNARRILESILLVLQLGRKRGVEITQYSILKILFLADRAHLNRYGRPVTFDNYIAMKHGPVASLTYDVLKHDQHALEKLGLNAPIWDRSPAPEKGQGAMAYSNARREPNLDVFSESDVEALTDAFGTVSTLTFQQIRKLTHEDPAYLEAWGNGGKTSDRMSYGLLFDAPDFDEADRISFISRHI